MIYLLYGTNTDKARAKLHELVDGLIKKKPDASHIRLTDENFSDAALDEHISGMGLFSTKTIIEADNIFRNKDAKESVLDRIKDIAGSDNIFVFLEGELNKAELTKFEKNAEKVQEFSLKTDTTTKREFNLFPLTDALGRKDRKQMWVLYTKAKRNGIADEQIHGLLFWKIKSLIQRNPNDSSLKKISSDLVALYHNARRGIIDFSAGLEKFILEM